MSDLYVDLVLGLVERIKPLLAGNDPEIQGAVLAELTAIWLTGHPQAARENLLFWQTYMTRKLAAINDCLDEQSHAS